jgi:hypothetical protein
MTFIIKDRIYETCTTTGTGTVTLLGAVAGYQAFSAIGNSNTCWYAIVHTTIAEWEVGVGTYTSSGTTLARTTVLASSNSGSAVNFSAGTKNVFSTLPGAAVDIDGTLAGNSDAKIATQKAVKTYVDAKTIAIGSVTGLGTGVATFLATPSSANLASAITDETGSGAAVFATSPTLVTPLLGTPTSGNLANCTFPTLNQNTSGSAATLTTARAIYGNNFDGSAALTQIIASTYGGTGNGFAKFSGPATSEKTFTLPNSSTTIVTIADTGSVTNTMLAGSIALTKITITGTPDGTKFLRDDGSWQTIPGGGDALTSNPLSQFAATTSLQFKGVISDETGSGAVVFATSPTLVTPILGTPQSGTLTSCTGLPISTGVSGLGTGVATWLATPSYSNLNSALTGDTVAGIAANNTFTGQDVFTQATTVTSGASAVLDDVKVSAATTTLTGTTHVTTAKGFNKVSLYKPTYTDSSSVTVDQGATLYIEDAPAASGSVTLTNAYALWVDNGLARFDGHLTVEGVTSTGATGTGKFVFDGTPTLVTPILGTPTSGTLTNCTGLPVAGITASTSTALGVGSLELGHASDTTLSRSSAGVLAVEGVVVDTVSATNTLTNKRITHRITTISSSATPTINTDNCDCVTITALGTAITSMTSSLSGTPNNFDKLIIRVKDDGSARGITWGTGWEAKGVALPTTTVTSKVLTLGFLYDTVTSKWGLVASAQEA